MITRSSVMESVLVVSVDFLPRIGGVSMMTHHLANGLSLTGLNTRVLAPAGACELPDLPAEYELIVDAQSRPDVRETPDYLAEQKRIDALLGAEFERQRFDYILLLHPFYYGLPALDFARRKGVQIGCFFHGFELKSQLLKPAAKSEVKARRADAYLDLRHSTVTLVNECDQIFVNSSVTGELINQCARTDYVITGCGLDRATFERELVAGDRKDTDVCRSALQLPQGVNLLGFLGRFVPSKNVGFLVRLLERLDGVHLALAGVGDIESLRNEAEKIGVLERVHFVGELSEADKWQFYESLDLFCLPSVKLPGGQVEGFGIVLLEAVLKGTPVAVSTQGGMRDFVLNSNGLYLDVDDVEVSALSIEALLANDTAAQKLVANAQSLLQRKLLYPHIATRIRAAAD